MKLVVHVMKPKNQKEQMFKVEAIVDESKKPGEASVLIDSKEYKIEIHS